MKTLLIGFLTLICWSAFSTHIYVCKIRGLCNEPESIQFTPAIKMVVTSNDTIRITGISEMVAKPKNLVTYFAFDKSEILTDVLTDKYLDETNKFLNQNSQAILYITGFTDAIGSDEYNLALGTRRVQSMKIYCQARGMSAVKIIIESKGESLPVDDNNTATGRANNRRTVITIKN